MVLSIAELSGSVVTMALSGVVSPAWCPPSWGSLTWLSGGISELSAMDSSALCSPSCGTLAWSSPSWGSGIPGMVFSLVGLTVTAVSIVEISATHSNVSLHPGTLWRCFLSMTRSELVSPAWWPPSWGSLTWLPPSWNFPPWTLHHGVLHRGRPWHGLLHHGAHRHRLAVVKSSIVKLTCMLFSTVGFLEPPPPSS